MSSAGARLRSLVSKAKTTQQPLQLLGAVNPYCAQLAQRAGATALYLSGSGVATASHGLPDLGITDLHDVVEDVRRITSVSDLPLLVDIDTGFGSAFNIARTIRELERAGAAGVHLEDQEGAKRCGHRPGKKVVSQAEMIDRIKAAVDARRDRDFVIMARSDALAVEGFDKTIARLKAYVQAGADMLFPEAFTKLEEYKKLSEELPNVPFLANITEFGKTPIYNTKQLGAVGVSMVLYPLSAHRAMAKAADTVYRAIIQHGSQESVLSLMQTRDDLYNAINYHSYENKLDQLYGQNNKQSKL